MKSGVGLGAKAHPGFHPGYGNYVRVGSRSMPDAASSTPNLVARFLLPRGASHDAWRMLAARGLRATCDGYMAVLLPAYLLALGLGQFEVGLVSTATLLGSAAATLWVGAWGHRFAPRALLIGAAMLMAATGAG